MKLRQSVLTSFFMILEHRGKQHKRGKRFSYIFYKPIFIILVHCHNCQVSRICHEAHGFLSSLTACVEISWDPAKSNQFLTLNFFVNVIPAKSISASFENIIFKIFWNGLKILSRCCTAPTFFSQESHFKLL